MRLTIQQSRGILGVSGDASPEQVRQAYRKLALQFHPDKNPEDPSATAKFQQLSAAYKRLCDHHSRRSGGNNRARSFDDGGESDEFSFGDEDGEDADLDDLDISFEEMLLMFELMFGGAGLGRTKPATTKTKAKKKKKKPSVKTATPGAREKAPPQVRVPLRSGRGAASSSRRAPMRGGFTSASLFGSAEDMLFETFATMEMAREMGGLDKDFESMRSFFGSSFGDSDFSFGSDVGSSECDDDNGPFASQRGVRQASNNQASAAASGAGSCEATPAPPASPTNQKVCDDSNAPPLEECKPEAVVAGGERKERAQGVEVGARVRVFGKPVGVVKFKGHVHYAKGDFVGVQLSEPLGKNDGMVKGVSYFACPPQFGLMVRPEDVALVEE